MAPAVEMQQFAHARPRLPPAAMAAAGAVAGQPTGVLQRRFHVGVRPLHAVVALRDLIEMAPVEAGVTLAIEPPDPLDLRAGRLARRGPSAAAIEQAVVAGGLLYLARQRRTVRSVHPMISAACLQLMAPLIARNITSRIVMARSRAAGG